MLVRGNKGFTLIELLIVIAIIVILAAVLIPNLLGARNRAQITSLIAELRGISTAMETYSLDIGRYPALATDGVLANFTRDYMGGKTPVVPWNRTVILPGHYVLGTDDQTFNVTIQVPTGGLLSAMRLLSNVANATHVQLTHDQGIIFIIP